jgi:tight adherence protein B
MVGLPIATVVSAGLVFLAVTLGTISLALILEFWRERNVKRAALRRLKGFGIDISEASESAKSLFRGDAASVGRLQALVVQIPPLRALEQTIEQAASSWTVPRFLFVSLGLGLAFGLAIFTITFSLPISMPIGALGGSLPYLLLRRKRLQRMHAFEEMLPDTIDLLGRAIRAGHPLSAGLKMVADESTEPVQGEFRRSFEEQRFGLPLDDSLMAMSDRVGLVDVRILTTAILIQRNVGGNLAEILDNLAYTIRERFKIRRQLRVYTAQGRMSGYVLALLPIAMGCVFYLLNPAYIKILFTDPAGKLAMAVAVVMQLIGFYWIRKIVDIEI